jgi:hypothetical protein
MCVNFSVYFDEAYHKECIRSKCSDEVGKIEEARRELLPSDGTPSSCRSQLTPLTPRAWPAVDARAPHDSTPTRAESHPVDDTSSLCRLLRPTPPPAPPVENCSKLAPLNSALHFASEHRLALCPSRSAPSLPPALPIEVCSELAPSPMHVLHLTPPLLASRVTPSMTPRACVACSARLHPLLHLSRTAPSSPRLSSALHFASEHCPARL